MSEPDSRYITTPIDEADAASGFSCGKHPFLDTYFARHAVNNDRADIGRTYVLRRSLEDPAEFPRVLGFYTLVMAYVESAHVPPDLNKNLPKYRTKPALLIGRFAIDKRVQRKRLGEKLLMDAFRRIVDAANIAGCLGVVVDAKDEDAEHFYAKYDFVTVTTESWPRRMFIATGTVRAAFDEP